MNSVEKYCRQVSRRLPARRDTRRRLLDGLAAEIDETLGGDCSMSEIIAAFGPPEQAAEELRQYIGEVEARAVRKAWRLCGIALVALCLVLITVILALVLFTASNSAVFSDADVYYIETDIETEIGGKIDETGFVSGADSCPVLYNGNFRLC